MVDVALSLGRLLVAVLLVVLNGFFVAAEFAFVRVRATSVEQLVEEGRTGAGALQDVMDDLDNYLAVTQLGITLASLGLGWAGEPAIASLLEPVLGSVLPTTLVHLVAIAVGFSVITFLHVVFGELAPKTFAIARTERLSLLLAPPMKLCYLLFYPGIVVFNGAANAFTNLLGVAPASESSETLGERELRRVLSQSGKEGHVDVAEVAMIERVFDLDDTAVREVMVPLPDVASVPADATLSDLRATVDETGHTRYPVVEADDATQVVGFVDVKDVLGAVGADSDGATTAGDLAREIIVVPETTAIDDLLRQFRDDRQQMAAVIDEWGSFEGIATVEDVTEAVVGDLQDTFDEREPSIHQRSDGGVDVDGSASLAAVNDVLGTELDHEAVETIGGLVLSRLDRAPEPGDTVEIDGHITEVTGVDGTRIATLRVRERDGETEREPDADGEESGAGDQ